MKIITLCLRAPYLRTSVRSAMHVQFPIFSYVRSRTLAVYSGLDRVSRIILPPGASTEYYQYSKRILLEPRLPSCTTMFIVRTVLALWSRNSGVNMTCNEVPFVVFRSFGRLVDGG